ncbi:MAG: DUF4349 domain-containing protein [Fibromonadaceae bacterium]|jgi:hypothetical protein|nr:DUF4349 domain-containing protein [Fibromonadaceae bacterium]
MRYIILITSVFLLMACSASKPTAHSVAYMEAAEASYSDDYYGGMVLSAPQPGSSDRAMARGSVRSAPPPMAMDAGWDNSMAVEAEPARVARMVNYNGNINLQSAEPEAVIDTVVERAKTKGGSVNSRRNGHVSLQIPVAEFRTFFDYVLTLGHVVSKNISANDITDAFADNAARLRIAENTLTRLQELLAVAKTEQEKIALLKEIQRVSEQIEQRKLEEKELLRRAAFSTIELWVRNIPVQAAPARINIKAFNWFAPLPNEGTHSRGRGCAPLKLKAPKDFIVTENSWCKWSTASALNTNFWAYERLNGLDGPQGTPIFWASAMLEYFKHDFKAELKTEEKFSLVRLQSLHTEPRIYYIAILKSTNKDYIRIAQAYFPTKEAEEKNSEAILETLRRIK